MANYELTPEQLAVLETTPFTKVLLNPNFFSDPSLQAELPRRREEVLDLYGIKTNEEEALEFITPFVAKAVEKGLFAPQPPRVPLDEPDDEEMYSEQLNADHLKEQAQLRGGNLIDVLVAGMELRVEGNLALMVEPMARRLRTVGLLHPDYSPAENFHKDKVYQAMKIGSNFAKSPKFIRDEIIRNPNSLHLRILLAILG